MLRIAKLSVRRFSPAPLAAKHAIHGNLSAASKDGAQILLLADIAHGPFTQRRSA
jgi:hypothetical protein